MDQEYKSSAHGARKSYDPKIFERFGYLFSGTSISTIFASGQKKKNIFGLCRFDQKLSYKNHAIEVLH